MSLKTLTLVLTFVKNKNKTIMKSCILGLLILVPGLSFSQEYKIGEVSKIVVEGTSTLHDWEMESNKSKGFAVLEFENSSLKSISDLEFLFTVETLKSGKSTMDNISYEALKTDKYPTIKFVLKDVLSINAKGDKSEVTARGNLTIAGVTRLINLKALASINNGNTTFSGEYSINMKDFNIDPPTAMFGTVKTGKDVKVKFETRFDKVGI